MQNIFAVTSNRETCKPSYWTKCTLKHFFKNGVKLCLKSIHYSIIQELYAIYGRLSILNGVVRESQNV